MLYAQPEQQFENVSYGIVANNLFEYKKEIEKY
jgi:hypothetical protein